MPNFFVGQRVRLVRFPHDGNQCSRVTLGMECVVVGTPSNPNHGFDMYRDRDLSVICDAHNGPRMAPGYCFEPITPSGHKMISWDECIWSPENVGANS